MRTEDSVPLRQLTICLQVPAEVSRLAMLVDVGFSHLDIPLR